MRTKTPRYDLSNAQLGWIKTSDDPLARNIRTLFGMYNAQADHACLGQLDAAVKELQDRWSKIVETVKVEGKT